MYLLNTFFLILGSGLTLFGIISFFLPSLTRFMNSPGGPKVKAIVTTSLGIIFIMLSLFVEMPIN